MQNKKKYEANIAIILESIQKKKKNMSQRNLFTKNRMSVEFFV